MGTSPTKMVGTQQKGIGAGFLAGAMLCGLTSFGLLQRKLKRMELLSSSQRQLEFKKADNGPLKEYSVVYTGRALNLMSAPFMQIMREISSTLREAYGLKDKGAGCGLIPGSGSYAMESVARQFGTNKKVLIIRNGYFSYRWSDIIHVTKITPEASETVIMAHAENKEHVAPFFRPPSIEDVENKIKEIKPAVVFAPHVETSTGIILPDDYVKRVAKAVHDVGGVFVLDSIASGTIWVDMDDTGVDVLVSAPQKGWSGPACCGIVMLSKLAMDKMEEPVDGGQSFACNLKMWVEVMKKYENHGFKYYTTLPTDALRTFHGTMMETKSFGWAESKAKLQSLGQQIRALLKTKGFVSVAAEGFEAPGVVVSYANCPPNKNVVKLFKEENLQIAGGVPFKLAFQPDPVTFRLGLFGLDKIGDVDACVSTFSEALDNILSKHPEIVSNNL